MYVCSSNTKTQCCLKAVNYSTAWFSRKFPSQFQWNRWISDMVWTVKLVLAVFENTSLLCRLSQLSDIRVLWANQLWEFFGFCLFRKQHFSILIKGTGLVHSWRKLSQLPHIYIYIYIRLGDSGLLADLFIAENKLGLINSSGFTIPSYLKTGLIPQLRIQWVPRQQWGHLLPWIFLPLKQHSKFFFIVFLHHFVIWPMARPFVLHV